MFYIIGWDGIQSECLFKGSPRFKQIKHRNNKKKHHLRLRR